MGCPQYIPTLAGRPGTCNACGRPRGAHVAVIVHGLEGGLETTAATGFGIGLTADIDAAMAKLELAAELIEEALTETARLFGNDDIGGALKVSEEAAQLVSSLVGTGGGEA